MTTGSELLEPEVWTTQLTPLSFLARSAVVHADRAALVHGDLTATYSELAVEVERRARMLRAVGIGPGDRVAYLMPNVPEMLYAHFAVPLAGGVLVAINTRLAPAEVEYILDHSGASVLVVDSESLPTIGPIAGSLRTVRTIAVVSETADGEHHVELPGSVTIDHLLREGESDQSPLDWSVRDENSPISINYTSGTTGRPKGVVYTHRGAYLSALGGVVHSKFHDHCVYLWTLPMFHCNGWCTTWAVVAAGGTQVCLREVRGERIWNLIDRYRVTHLSGAPTVVTTILTDSAAHQIDHPVIITVAGAPPSPTTLAEAEAMGFSVVHVYGLTETYGPYTVCVSKDSWQSLATEQRAKLTARQGVAMLQADRVRVIDPTRNGPLVDVPADGQTLGEIVMRGNSVMRGYHRDEAATAAAFAGGWFHSGDLGVMHPDGYIELRDRAKDVIVSGGENISTVEVEHAIASHVDVLEVAVIGVPDDDWGERPKAFVVARQGRAVDEPQIREYLRSQIARYKVPRDIVVVTELPKTSTGKVQKFELREREWAGEAARVRG
ncbi:UNVERIFIED_ORG: fatty-acyl-CoA synthase [Gordonia westfalica J30]